MDHDAWDDELTPDEDVLTPEPVERASPTPAHGPRRATVRFGMSVPGAIGGVLLIGAIAFGANLGLTGSRPDVDGDTPDPTPTAKVAVVDGDADGKEPTKKPKPTAEPTAKTEPTTAPKPTEKAEPTKKPTPEPTKKPEPKPTAKPEPKPTEKPVEKPVLEIAVAVKEGSVLVKWSACYVDGADYYKVVRSTDSTVKWPAGDNDKVVAAVELGGTPKAWDEGAPGGKKVWYRVFCVKHTDDGYKVLAASAAKAVVVPDEPKPTPKPTPETAALWIEAGVDGGAVVLSWEACGSDGFSHYRIIRKVDGEGGVIAEIEDAGTTSYVDGAVEPGVTYTYIVQAKGTIDGDWVLLGSTEWVVVTVE